MDSQLLSILERDLKQLSGVVDEIEDLYIKEFKIETDFLRSLYRDINKEIKQSPFELKNAFSIMQKNSIIEFEAEILENKVLLLSTTQSKKTAISYLVKKITSWVKSFGARLWQIICNLLTPYEWSIKGGIGSNSLFGLGNVQIQIKFGDKPSADS